MSHSLLHVWLHVIFHTKYNRPLITEEVEPVLFEHLRMNIEERLGCLVVAIGGMPDHIHILIRLDQHHSIKELVRKIKGESSHWMNEQRLTEQTFQWQIGYGVYSVSESLLGIVSRYIGRQKIHHRERSVDADMEYPIKNISPSSP